MDEISDPVEKLADILRYRDIDRMCSDIKSIRLMTECETEKIHHIGGEICFITYKQVRSHKRHLYVVIFKGLSIPRVLDVETDHKGEVETVRHVSGSFMLI